MDLKECKGCKKILSKDHFRRVRVIGDKSYYYSSCVECKNPNRRRKYSPRKRKIIELDNNINIENYIEAAIKFIKKIEKQKGYIDVIDCYRLASHFTNIFGYLPSRPKMKDDVKFMWDKLKKIVNENKSL